MKTLIVAPFSPYPLVFGGAIRLYYLAKMFASFSEVTLLHYASWSDGSDSTQHLETFCQRVVTVENPANQPGRKRWLQLQATLSRHTFQYFSHYSRGMQQQIDQLLLREQFDCIVVEQTQMGYFAYRQPDALHILDLQNIEHELLQRRANVEQQPLKRLALGLEARKFAREELAIYKQFDLVFTTSERERDLLRRQLDDVAVEAVANTVDPDFFALRTSVPTANEITFIGTTHVDANRDGLVYFMQEVFPLIEQRVPDVHFTIVGGSPPPEIRAFGNLPNVDVTGYVKDVRDYMAHAKALVVPLRSGGGTRLKILEGLSYGVPTVSTSVGTEGIATVHGEHLLIGDTAQTFADQVLELLGNSQLQERLSLQGRQLVEERYSWKAVGRDLQRYIQNALHKNGDRAATQTLPLGSQGH